MMLNRRLTPLTLALAALTLASCATREDVSRVEERVLRMERDLTATRAAVGRVDSLARSEQSGKSEYVRLQSMIEELTRQVEQLTNNVTELQSQIGYLQSRAGSQTGTVSAQQADNAESQPASGVDCAQLYDDSFIQIRQGEYAAARAGFADYLQYCPNGEMADNAQFWIAESFYSQDKFPEAKTAFEELSSKFGDSEKMPTALYKLGRCSEEASDLAAAKKYYQRVVTEHPSTTEAGLAKDKLIELTGESANRGG
ncbi:MAG TPA: tol-pal system protein YbgF [candidate division Zixibacteria bacterium]|nr:tol-pal system protein YbgF [candidate division Zixibacteria bacterium]